MFVNCNNCDKEFNKSSYEIKKSPNHYCSRSCAASFNNKKFVRRKKSNKCIDCGTLIYSSKQRCQTCFSSKTDRDTIADVIYNKKGPSSYSIIRYRARVIAKELGWSSCFNCGYSHFIEICHIKPISDFPLDTLVIDVNSKNNLVGLCRNCHWELDHNLITVY